MWRWGVLGEDQPDSVKGSERSVSGVVSNSAATPPAPDHPPRRPLNAPSALARRSRERVHFIISPHQLHYCSLLPLDLHRYSHRYLSLYLIKMKGLFAIVFLALIAFSMAQNSTFLPHTLARSLALSW
jgi:hypothetical protein